MLNQGLGRIFARAALRVALAAVVVGLAACAPTYDEARAGPPLRTIAVSTSADRLLPCMDRLLVAAWAARGATIARAQTRAGRFGELVIDDRGGPLLLIEVLTRSPYESRVDMRALRLRVDTEDLDRIATVAEACSS